MDFDKYLEDYYLLKISMEEICEIENIKYDVFYKVRATDMDYEEIVITKCEVLNFDSNQLALKNERGFYIIHRRKVTLMHPSR